MIKMCALENSMFDLDVSESTLFNEENRNKPRKPTIFHSMT